MNQKDSNINNILNKLNIPTNKDENSQLISSNDNQEKHHSHILELDDDTVKNLEKFSADKKSLTIDEKKLEEYIKTKLNTSRETLKSYTQKSMLKGSNQATSNNEPNRFLNPFYIFTKDFLTTYTPEKIKNMLDEYIIGQEEAKKQCALQLYYHMMRVVHPTLPIHNLMIVGPSGSGKTEIWRILHKLFPQIPIIIFDAARITVDGFAGSLKISNVLSSLDTIPNKEYAIIIFDEFDKFCTPQHTQSRDNISYEKQAEILKLIEGDGIFEYKNNDGYINSIQLNNLSFVFVGAFETIFLNKNNESNTIGFGTIEKDKHITEIVDEQEFLDFGIRAEILGRISNICFTNPLTKEHYLEIINNQHSKVSIMQSELKGIIDCSIDDEMINQFITEAEASRTGTRGILARIENVLLNRLYHTNISESFFSDNNGLNAQIWSYKEMEF